jgi:hypothetical protein
MCDTRSLEPVHPVAILSLHAALGVGSNWPFDLHTSRAYEDAETSISRQQPLILCVPNHPSSPIRTNRGCMQRFDPYDSQPCLCRPSKAPLVSVQVLVLAPSRIGLITRQVRPRPGRGHGGLDCSSPPRDIVRISIIAMLVSRVPLDANHHSCFLLCPLQ